MVFTILPCNSTRAGAEYIGAKIILNISDEDDLVYETTKFKLILLDQDNKMISDDKYKVHINKLEKTSVIELANVSNAQKYNVIISYDGCLDYKNSFIADNADDNYHDVTLYKDTFTDYAFEDKYDSLQLNAKDPCISTNISVDKMDGFTQTFESGDSSIADIDNSGKVTIKKAGNVKFTARLYKNLADGGIIYKEITKNVTME